MALSRGTSGSSVQWAQHEIYETIQVRDRLIRVNRQLLDWLIESVQPDCGITERLCTGGIPASKRREYDVTLA
jgi:hypothetical protein